MNMRPSAVVLTRAIMDNGGFTLNPVSGEFVSEGYALSIDTNLTRVIERPVIPLDVFEYTMTNWSVLRQDDKFLGAWLDSETGFTHLDVVTVFEDREEAIKHGRFYGELAIFDLSKGEEIRLSYEVGDVDPYPWTWEGPEGYDHQSDPGCPAQAQSGYVCSMPGQHNSPHVAGNGREILDVWGK